MKVIKKIGIVGPSQIYHLIPVLEQQYSVVNLQKILDEKTNGFVKLIKFVYEASRIDVLYNVFNSPFSYKKFNLVKLFGVKTITHWIGTDVRYAVEGKTDLTKLHNVDKHVVCFEALQEDLYKLGISADILPITPFNLEFKIAEMPKSHAVIIYMPKGVEDDYGFDEIERVFPKYPNVPFYIVANDDKEKFAAYPNVYPLGRLTKDEMETLYNKVSIVVRIHISDGLSMSVLEGLAKGKKVVWNCKYPFAYPGSTTDEICNSLDEIFKNPPQADTEAHTFINKEYTKDKFLVQFNDSLHSIK